MSDLQIATAVLGALVLAAMWMILILSFKVERLERAIRDLPASLPVVPPCQFVQSPAVDLDSVTRRLDHLGHATQVLTSSLAHRPAATTPAPVHVARARAAVAPLIGVVREQLKEQRERMRLRRDARQKARG